jgi:hypothetical protein
MVVSISIPLWKNLVTGIQLSGQNDASEVI